MDCSPLGSPVLGDSSGKNTGVGCNTLLHGIFPTQGLNLRFLPWQADSLPQLSYHVSLCSEARLNTLNLDLMTSH